MVLEQEEKIKQSVTAYVQQREKAVVTEAEASENSASGMISIMERVHDLAVPHTRQDNKVIERIVFGGDVLTNERAFTAQQNMQLNKSEVDRFAGIIHRPEGLHRQMNFLLGIYQQFYKENSSSDVGSLYRLRNVINRRDVQGPESVINNFRSHHDFVNDVTDAYIIGAFLDNMDLDTITSTPENLPVFSLMNSSEKTAWLKSEAYKILDVLHINDFQSLDFLHKEIQKLDSDEMCIKWPEVTDFPDIARQFNEMGAYNFPNIIGAIDGCHIQIEAPLQNSNSYYNRKKYFSLQAVCKNDLQFIDVNVGWPGRVHDAKVLRNSSLWEAGFEKTAHGRFHLLGDAAYPLKQWLLTPYRDTGQLNRQQLRYNLHLSSKRQVIERAFALLKSRFRRLKYLNIKSELEMCRTIICACILHNVCILENDNLLDDVIDVDSNGEDGGQGSGKTAVIHNDAQGSMKRLLITNRL
ncbi:hypothetical protein FSP39_014714 [Pinctada imbricata]|uniref:Harbinger transposase-derived nuclease n=1 Tax=Pinctada imbricata TaxID=66713 RepID=A0AA88YTT3_PINIB|nr:hypothetical protein FSP39_014714 [Pinctada imbricata]